MKIKRTANSGVLLELDGVRLLLDGVCAEVKPYLPTPEPIRRDLLSDTLDAVVFTHAHEDHYDAAFVSDYLRNAAGPILGPADIPFTRQENLTVKGLRITQIPTHHIGRPTPVGHHSFILEGSRCVWFVGDASPLQWKRLSGLPGPDVLIAPYAYAIGTGWQVSADLCPQTVVLLHLPEKDADPYALWNAVEKTTAGQQQPELVIPEMGEMIEI